MIFDIIFGVVIIGMLLKGFFKGMVYMVFGLVKILIALLLTPYFIDIIYDYIKNYEFPIDINVVAYIITFLLIVTIISICQYLIEKFLGAIGLGFLNKILGGILGLAEGYIITMIIIISSLFAKDYNSFVNEQINRSQIAYYISLYTKEFNSLFPKVINEKLDDFYIQNKKIEITNNVLDKIDKEN